MVKGLFKQYFSVFPFYSVQVWCGPSNCLSHVNESRPAVPCAQDEVCTPLPTLQCFTPPCLPWGYCHHANRPLEDHTPALGTPASCDPGSDDILDTNCGRITLLFDRTRVPVVSLSETAYINICCCFRVIYTYVVASEL